MQKLVITGGVALEGEIKASGAKNAALPLLACALLTDEPMTFVNVPDLADVHTMLKLLEELGCKVTQEGHKVTIGASHITSTEAPYDLVKTMRLFWCSARCSHASERPKCRFPAAARSVPAQWTSTSRASKRSGPTFLLNTDMLRRMPTSSSAPIS